VEQALTAYYQAAEQAARIRAAAKARAARVSAQAEVAAAVPDAEAARAVAELRALGEVNAEIARLCGISVAAVRKLAAAGKQETGLAEPAVSGDAEASGESDAVPDR